MDISSNEAELIVKQVIAGLGTSEKSRTPGPSVLTLPPLDHQSGATVYDSKTGSDGVFDGIEDAVETACQAQWDYIANYKVHDRWRIIEAIRGMARDHVETMYRMIMEETKMEHYENKLKKHLTTISKMPGPGYLNTEAISGDEGLMLEEHAPFSVIAAITPATNPTETIIDNTISMTAGGNTVIFSVHPTARQVSAYCLQLLNRAIMGAGGPENLITMAKEPTMENVNKLVANPHIRMMVGAGDMSMVNALLCSSKKIIGTGVDNPPVITDETADAELADREMYKRASFDNNIFCFAEKETFVVESAADGFLYNLRKQGAYLLDNAQTERPLSIVFQPKKQGNGYGVNKQWVGRGASHILERIGITDVDTRLLICEVEKGHPLVTVEQMMPTLPIARRRDFEQVVEWAVETKHGNRHTASILSRDMEHMTRFAKAIEVTTYARNHATMAGVSIRGGSHCIMTIAGPTEEGITNTKSLTGHRRCILAEGGLRTI